MARPSVRFSVFGADPVIVSGDGWAAITSESGVKLCDVYRFRNECGVAYGDVDAPRTVSLSGSLAIEMLDADGQVTEVVVDTEEAYIEYGQMLPYWTRDPEWSIDSRDAPYRDYLLGGGPSLDVVPREHLADFERWGPNPDPEDTDQTGSGRVFSQRNPITMSMLIRDLHGDSPTPAQLQDAKRWVREQASRGYCFYRSSNDYAIFDALAEQEHIVGQGYRAGGGGFSELYGSERPEGVVWEKSGRACGDASHMTIQSLVDIGVFLRSWTAMRLCGHHMQGVTSFLAANAKWASRAYGWYFKSLGHLTPVMHYLPLGKTAEALSLVLDSLEARNWLGAPAPDSGKVAEGGHLTGDEVKAFVGLLPGVTDEMIQDAAKSDCSWMVGILISGLDTLIELWDRYGMFGKVEGGAGLRERLMTQYKYAVNFIVNFCGKHGLDIGKPLSEAYRRPALGVFDDVGPMYRLAEGGDAGNTARGVYIRFLVPALYLAASRFPESHDEILALAKPTLAVCDGDKYWGTTNFTHYMLESGWPVGVERGWWVLI